MDQYEIVFESHPLNADLDMIESGLNEFDRAEFGRADNRPFTFFLRDRKSSIVGGVIGNTGLTWAYISALWVTEHLRGTGFGGQLIRAAEREAVDRGCRHCYLDTFNPRALEFYKKEGYEVFGELEDFLPMGKRFFLRKDLV